MSKNKKNKKQKKHPPPLSLLDTVIYLIVIIISFSMAFCGFLFSFAKKPAFLFNSSTDCALLAYASTVPGFFLSAISLFSFWFITGWITNCYLENQPIFGDKKIRYESPKYKRVYPMFGREKKVHMTIMGIQIHYRVIRFIAIVLLFATITVGCLGIYPRYQITGNSTIEEFNSFNQKIKVYDFCNIESSSIIIRHQKRHYFFEFKLTMNDTTELSFLEDEFVSLNSVLKLKESIENKNFTIENIDEFEKLVSEYRQSQQPIIRQIFEQ